MKIIGVTPAGRRRYLEMLVPHLLNARDVLDEHHFWLNTKVKSDIQYIQSLAEEYPDFFKITANSGTGPLGKARNIWSFFRHCTEADVVYVRVDDDVCWIDPSAFREMAEFRHAHPEPFLICGNVVNNAVCSHYHQQQGQIPREWGTVENDCLDINGWESPKFARQLHEKFLEDIEKGRSGDWKKTDFGDWDGLSRFSINAIAWYGHDMAQVAELSSEGVPEEPFLTEVLPARFSRPNAICPDALFGHFAFYVQRRYLESFGSLQHRYLAIGERRQPPPPGGAAKVWESVRGALHLATRRRYSGRERRKLLEVTRSELEAL